jgi:hypothetical protein
MDKEVLSEKSKPISGSYLHGSEMPKIIVKAESVETFQIYSTKMLMVPEVLSTMRLTTEVAANEFPRWFSEFRLALMMNKDVTTIKIIEDTKEVSVVTRNHIAEKLILKAIVDDTVYKSLIANLSLAQDPLQRIWSYYSNTVEEDDLIIQARAKKQEGVDPVLYLALKMSLLTAAMPEATEAKLCKLAYNGFDESVKLIIGIEAPSSIDKLYKLTEIASKRVSKEKSVSSVSVVVPVVGRSQVNAVNAPHSCNFCGKEGHVEDKCWSKYPDLKKDRRRNKKNKNNNNNNNNSNNSNNSNNNNSNNSTASYNNNTNSYSNNNSFDQPRYYGNNNNGNTNNNNYSRQRGDANHAGSNVRGGNSYHPFVAQMNADYNYGGHPDSGKFSFPLLNESLTTSVIFVSAHKFVVGLDSMANISLVKGDVPFVREEDVNLWVRYANGSYSMLKKLRYLRFKWFPDGVEHEAKAYVSDQIPTDLLLSRGVMSENKLVLDFALNKIWVSERPDGFVGAIESKPDSIDERYCVGDIYYPCLVGLDDKWRKMIRDYILKFTNLAIDGWVVSELPEFVIDTVPHEPMARRAIEYSEEENDIIEKKLLPYLEGGALVPAPFSPYQHQVVLSSKYEPDGSLKYRPCPNLIPLNNVTIRRSYPLPVPKLVAQKITGRFKTLIDAQSGYMHIPLRESDWEKTTIKIARPIKGYGDKFMFRVMPWGAMNAGNHYQVCGEGMLRGSKEFPENLLGECAEVLQDDAVIHDEAEDVHFKHVEQVLARMLHYRMPPNFMKCVFMKEKLKWCGMVIGVDGIEQDEQRVQGLANMRFPRSYPELNVFIGHALWHKEFVENFSGAMEPLFSLKRDGLRRIRWHWDTDADGRPTSIYADSFRKVIELISKRVLLSFPGPGVYHMYCDYAESNRSISAQLFRIDKGKKFLMGYQSHVLNDTERKESRPLLEFMAIWFGSVRFSNMLKGREVVVYTDHKSLAEVDFGNLKGKWARMMSEIQEIFPRILPIPGAENVVADCMTRLNNVLGYVNHVRIVDSLEEKKMILDFFHGIDGGHFSARKTVLNIRAKYDWPGISADVEKHIADCNYCDRNAHSRVETRAPLTPIVASRPWEIAGIDLVGPFLLKNGEKKFALAAVDYFSKEFVWEGLADGSASVFLKKLEDEIVNRKGAPLFWVGDHARQWLGNDMLKFCEKTSSEMSPATDHHQQANGQVEKMIDTAKRVTHQGLDSGLNWRAALRNSRKILNNILVSDSTKKTAFEIMHGEQWNSPLDNGLLKLRQEKQVQIKSEAAQNSAEAKQKQKNYYDKGKMPRKFKPGDWVMVTNFFKTKWLEDRRVGPFKVIAFVGNDNYVVFDHFKKTYKSWNVQHMFLTNRKSETPPPLSKSHIPNSGSTDVKSLPEVTFRDELLGKRISVLWELVDEFENPMPSKEYEGLVVSTSSDSQKGTHLILYDDEVKSGHMEPIYDFLTSPDPDSGRITQWKFCT